ncbi:protein kinase, partial [Acidobacteria bacterium AH-259-A15]|nr:protein kinase [Acidobacteria bacterium AH-259-A15]
LQKSAEIAEALEKAHQRGIIHRDLKPSNIMLTPEGHVKVMDFGLAKQLIPAEGIGSQEETLSASLTKTGATLGTLAYMSPEQLRGEDVDTRSDVFSFGIVLYEMLTGVHPFKKAQPMETGNAILNEAPAPLFQYINEVPSLLQHTVRKMLAKEPSRRYQVIHDVGTDLGEVMDGTAESATTQAGIDSFAATAREIGAPVVQRPWRQMVPWVLLTAMTMVAVIVVVFHVSEAPDELRTRRFSVFLPGKISFAPLDLPVISPDGRHIAFTGVAADSKQLLWVHSLDSLTARPLTGTDGAALAFWSPDGRFIGFFADGKLKKIRHTGGPAQTLCDAPLARGGTWNCDGVILFGTRRDGLYRVSEAGGTATPVTTLDKSRGELSHRWPYFLPDSRHFLYTVEGPQSNQGDVYHGSFDSKDVKQLLSDYSNAVYAPPGYLLFVREDTLMAQPFDAKALQIMGQAFPVAEEVVGYPGFGLGQFSASQDGVLVYHPGFGVRQRQLVWVDREGHEEPLAAEPRRYGNPQLSPDGARLAIRVTESGNTDVWIYDLARETLTRLTFDPATDGTALDAGWSPGGVQLKPRRRTVQSVLEGG